MGDNGKDGPLFSASNGWFNRFKKGQVCKILNLLVRLQVQILMLPKFLLQNYLN
jgi:hypothetical protein